VELAKELYFQEVAIVTVYNPAHLIRKLRGIGFSVDRIGKSRTYRVKKQIGEGCLEFFGLNYYTNLVKGSLMREETMVKIMSHLSTLVESGRVKPRTRIDLDICQHF
jgi:hypothetical protein